MSERKTQILLVDDHPLVRQGLAYLISQEPDLAICGEAEDVAEAIQCISRGLPDIIILDLSLKSSSGLDLIKHVKAAHPSLPIIVLSTYDEREYAERVLRLGARGYIMKNETAGHIVPAIRQVMSGAICISDAVSASFAERIAGGAPAGEADSINALSDREIEVLRFLGKGLSTREIAETLNISISTVQVYCGRIKTKLGLANAMQLIRRAVQWVEEQ